jgi:hypothetical protein
MEGKKIFTPDFIQIPHQVVMNKKLQPLDRLLYGVVYWYEKLKDGKCTASNKTMGAVLGIENNISVANSLTRLENEGCIKRYYRDKQKKMRDRIECLIVYEKRKKPKEEVSSNDDTVSPDDDRGVSSNDEQKKNKIEKNSYGTPPLSEEELIQKGDAQARKWAQ